MEEIEMIVQRGGDDDGGDYADEEEGNQEGNDPEEFEDCIVPPGRDPSDVDCG